MTQQSEAGFTSPFADFFTFPQYSSSTNRNSTNEAVAAENHSAIADIEVSMVESHAALKVFSKRRPKQLLKMVAGLQNLHLTILHLNVTSIGEMLLYSLSVKVGTWQKSLNWNFLLPLVLCYNVIDMNVQLINQGFYI